MKTIFIIIAIIGSINCGLVMCKAEADTKWNSKIGRWAIIGLILLFAGLGGTIYLT